MKKVLLFALAAQLLDCTLYSHKSEIVNQETACSNNTTISSQQYEDKQNSAQSEMFIYDDGSMMLETDNEQISCSIRFASRQETQKLFFIPDFKHCLEKFQQKTGIATRIHASFNTLFDKVTKNVLQRDNFCLEPTQKKVLEELATLYQPAMVSIINLSEEKIIVNRNECFGNLSHLIIPTQRVLSTYPDMEQLEQTGMTRTKIYAGITAASCLLAGTVEHFLADSYSTLSSLLLGIFAIPSITFGSSAAHRWMQVHKPLNDLLCNYEELHKRSHNASAYLLEENSIEKVENEGEYVLPARSVFTELVFFDRHKLTHRSGQFTNCFIYKTEENIPACSATSE